MAGRVNTKFVAILSSLLVVFILALVVGWYFMSRVDPKVYVAQGDQAAAEQRWDKAAELYGRAKSQIKNNASLHIKYAEAKSKVKVSDDRLARNSINSQLDSYRKALNLDPANEEALKGLADLYIMISSTTTGTDGWNQLYLTTQSNLRSAPDNYLAMKYRGIAQVNRMLQAPMTSQEIEEAYEDLETAQSKFPDDPEIGFHMALWHIAEAERHSRPGGSKSLVKQNLNDAVALTTEMVRQHRDDAQVMLYHIRILKRAERDAEAIAMVNQVAEQVRRSPDAPKLVLDTADWLVTPLMNPDDGSNSDAIDKPGLRKAEDLMKAAIAKHPSDLRLQIFYGRVLESLGKNELAMKSYLKTSSAEVNAVPQVAYQALQIKRLALVRHTDLILKEAIEAESETIREQKLADVEALIDQIEGEGGSTGAVHMLKGKVAMARKEYHESLKHLDLASSLYDDQQPEVLLLSANVCMKLGELGAAVTRLENLVKLRPDYMPGRYQLVRLYLRVAKADRAAEEIADILRTKPNDFLTHSLRAQLYGQTARIDDAIKLYEKLDPKKHGEIALPLARLYINTGAERKAFALLDHQFRKDPTNLALLREITQLLPNPQQSLQYIEVARNAGVEEAKLQLIETGMPSNTERDVVADVNNLLSHEDDPVTRNLKRYSLFWRLGKLDEARAALKEAVKADPDNPGVVEAQFNVSLVDKKWDLASGYVNKATAMNADKANGAFFRGQFALAQGHAQKAISEYTAGLDARPVYSDGWRLLGDAHRQSGNIPSAITAYQRALEQRPDNITARRNLIAVLDDDGRYTEALEQYRRSMQFSATNDAMRERYLTYEQDHGSKERALELRLQIAKKSPSDTTNRRGLAILYASMRKFAEAKQTLEKLFVDDGRTRQNVRTYAMVLAFAGDHRAGGRILEDHVKSMGADATIEDWLTVARYHRHVGLTDESIAAYRTAITMESEKDQAATRELADLLFDHRRFADAEKVYGQLWKSDPNDARIGHRYVEALIRDDRLDEAKSVLDRVVTETGEDAAAHLLYSLIAQVNKDYMTALAHLNKAESLAPDRAIVFFERAAVRYRMNEGNESQAIEDLKRSLELDPNMLASRHLLSRLYLQIDDPREAIRQLQEVLKRDPYNAQTRLLLLEMYENHHETLAAKSLLSESARLFPGDAQWPRLQANMAIAEQNHRAAIKYLEDAFNRLPSADVLGDLAIELILTKRASAALSVLEQKMEMTQNDPTLRAIYGRVLINANREAEGESHMAAAWGLCKRIEQGFAVAAQMVAAYGLDNATPKLESFGKRSNQSWAQTALARQEIAAGQPQKAVNRLKQTQRQISNEDLGAFRGLLAMALDNSGNEEEAASVYNQMVTDNPNNVAALNNLAYLLATKLNRPQDAVPFAEQAAEIRPNDAQVLDTLGWVQFQSGNTDAAQRTLRRSVRIRPMAANNYHLARVMVATGESSSAKQVLDTAVQLAELEKDSELAAEVRQYRDELNG